MNWQRCCTRSVLILSIAILTSCSKPARAKRHLVAAQKAFDEARGYLLTGDMERARVLSDASKQHAQKASALLQGSPLAKSSSKQLDASSALAGLFSAPESAVRLWLIALAAKDFDLAERVFDLDPMLQAFFDGRAMIPTPSEWEEFRQLFAKSYRISLQKYAEYLSSWEIGDVVVKSEGEEMVLDCLLKLLGSQADTRFWIKKKQGIWRIRDFSTSSDKINRSSDVMRRMSSQMDQDADLKSLFEGKGIFDVMAKAASVSDSGKESVAWQNPLVGHNMRTRAPTQLFQSGAEVSVPIGTMLMVVQQHKSDKAILFVRTTEANEEERCIGEVRLEDVEDVGTDETELWQTKPGG